MVWKLEVSLRMKNMIRYCFLQSFLWMLYASTFGYVTVYLSNEQVPLSSIGIITGFFSILAALLQIVSGRFVDSKKFSWKQICIFLLLTNILSGTIMCLFHLQYLQMLLFGLTLLCTSVSMPLVNRAAFICSNPQHKINFGIARGLGSLFYAVLAFILGKSTVRFGFFTVPLSTAFVSLLMLIPAFLLNGENDEKIETIEKSSKEKNNSIFTLIKKYPEFFAVWFACILQMTFHNLYGTYLINICQKAGGNSSNLGTALSVAALCELPVMFAFSLIYKRVKSKSLLLISAICYVVRGIGFLFAKTMMMVYAVQILQILSFAIFASASVYYAEESLAPEERSTGQAFMGGTQTIGAVLGSITGGFLIEKTNIDAALIFGVIICVISTLILLVCKVLNHKENKSFK